MFVTVGLVSCREAAWEGSLPVSGDAAAWPPLEGAVITDGETASIMPVSEPARALVSVGLSITLVTQPLIPHRHQVVISIAGRLVCMRI